MFAEYAGSGSDAVLSAEALAKLLREKQGDHRSETPAEILAQIKRAVAAKWRQAAAGEAPTDAVEDEALKRFGQGARRLAEAASADSGAAASSAAGASASAGDGDAAAIAAATLSDDPKAAADAEARAAAQRKAAAEATKTGAADAGGLSLQEFASYLCSPELNGPLEAASHDMGHPLAHYFISSTHNSYLSGNQLNGVSTADAIRRALALGARVIELDCYSEPDAALGTAEPWVTHGGTLTSKLPFRAAVRAIAEYAFREENVVPTSAPVILTLENHCSVSGNEVQAAILKEELGTMLYVPASPRPAAYPSPAALMGKVVLRDKPGRMLPYEGAAAVGLALAAVEEDEDEEEEEDDDEAEQAEAQAAAIRAGEGTMAGADAAAAESSGKEKKKQKGKKKHKELHPNLMALVAIPNTKFKAFDAMDRYAPGPASSSFSEEKMEAIAKGSKAKGSPAKVTTLAQTHLVRVYPKGVRVDSSNFDPGRFWALGCQLTALNYQHGDRSVYANQAQFAQNGGLGYVLKPDWMLAPSVAEYAAVGGTGKRRPGDVKPVTLTVTVISGHFLPKPRGYHEAGDIIDPFVEVHIVGAPADTALHATGTIDDNGFNPRWLDPTTPSLKPTKTFTISRPDVAVLLFVVKDKNLAGSVTVAQAGVPIRALRTGVRALGLQDALSVPLVASKLMIRTHLA
jgi:hypothetical protein